MTLKDAAGYRVSGATPESVAAFEEAQQQLRCYLNDPVATVDRALAASPTMSL